jgi:hypothetical protein
MEDSLDHLCVLLDLTVRAILIRMGCVRLEEMDLSDADE